jgi:nicotinamidase/pyrazinamidase
MGGHMKNIFFVDVDTQYDLMQPAGTLYVPGAERLISKLLRLFSFAKTHAVTVVSTANVREADDPPAAPFLHGCLRGTSGQRKLPETLLLHPVILENKPLDRSFPDLVRKHQQIIVEKSEFDVFSNPHMDKLLRVLPANAILFGVPTEHSIKLAALGLRRRGIKAAVVQNVILPLRARDAASAESAMRGSGVEFIGLEVLLGAQPGD